MRAVLSLLVVALALLVGCAADEIGGLATSNQPPQVWLSVAPPEGSEANYRVRLFWRGWDPDGTISAYEYAITDNDNGMFNPADTVGAWHTTLISDSLFFFSADILSDSSAADTGEMNPLDYERSHTFLIRSIDNRGARSDIVHRSFTATTLSPIVSITAPRALGFNIPRVAPVITFRWLGIDYVSDLTDNIEPDSTRSALIVTSKFNGVVDEVLGYLRTTPDAPEWTRWSHYNADDGAGRGWQSDKPLAFGTYVFAVQAKDEAGAVTPMLDRLRNVATFRVSQLNTGPVLIVSNRFLGTFGSSTRTAPPQIRNLPGGVPIQFTWSADASSYGGTVSSYRYGWDIHDLNDAEDWEVDWTPFIGPSAKSATRTFFFGTHTFHVEAKDNSGAISRVQFTINIIPFTMERDVLLIDDWNEYTSQSFRHSSGASPNDSEHDAFWLDVLRNVKGFVPALDVHPQAGVITVPSITTVAHYKTIIWNVRTTPNLELSEFGGMVRWGSRELNLLRLFFSAGGKLLICGDTPMTDTLDKDVFVSSSFFGGDEPRYPVITRYEIAGNQDGLYLDQDVGTSGVGDESFVYDDCCLNVVDIAYGLASLKWRQACGVQHLRNFIGRDEGMRAATPVDTKYNMPRLELRPEAAGLGRVYAPGNLGLNTDLYNPQYFGDICTVAESVPLRSCFEPMYALECPDVSSGAFGATIAYWNSRYADVPDIHGNMARSAVWGFSPVYFNPDQVRDALEIILFDEWQLERK